MCLTSMTLRYLHYVYIRQVYMYGIAQQVDREPSTNAEPQVLYGDPIIDPYFFLSYIGT